MKTLNTYITEASIRDMIDLIKNNIDKCDDQTIKYTYNRIISNTLKDDIRNFLSSKFNINGKVNEVIIDDLIDHAIKYGDIEALSNLSKTQRLISFQSLLNNDNIKVEINKLGYNFSDNYIDWISTYTSKNRGKGMGVYEILLQLFVQGGHLTDKGDVGIDENKEIEMKGKDARLTGQGDWGNGTSVSEMFIDILSKSKNKQIYKSFIDQLKENKQLYYKNDCVFYQLIENIKKDTTLYKEVLSAWCMGLSKLYKKLPAKDIYNYLDNIDVFNRNGKIDYNKVIYTCAALDLFYYAKREQFNYICFFGGKTKATINKYKIFDAKIITNDFKNAYDIISTYFNCSCPNTKDKATSQDSFSQINIK